MKLNKLTSLLISLFLEILFFSPSYATQLTPVEKRIRDNVIYQQKQQLLLLQKLVNINSGTTHVAGVIQVGKILQLQFKQLGFKTQWISQPKNMHRAPTLIAAQRGNNGKRLLLIGHLDTVFPEKSTFQKFQLQGKFARGPGIVDDKGGDVIILYALKALQAAQALKHATITIVLTGDEEESGKPTSISRKPLFDAAKQSDIALDFESAISADTATIARRGITNWRLTTTGKEAHSSGIFQDSVGDGAIFELARILNTLREQLSTEKYLTFNPGLILGGTTIQDNKNSSQGTAFGRENVVAKFGIVKGDLRFLSLEQKMNAEKKIMVIVNQHLPGTTAFIQFQDGIPAMPPTAENLALLEKYHQASNDLGYGLVKPLNPSLRGAGDISHIATMVSANLAGLGPIGPGAHSEKETLEVDSLVMQTERAAILIYRLTR